jgi:DNA repair exonuclease SbcCD ATPase subunit
MGSLNAHKNDLEKYLVKAHTRFYPSTKRLEILQGYQTKLQKDRDEFGMKVIELSSQKNATEYELQTLKSGASKLEELKKQWLETKICPQCGASISLDKKMAALNTYEEEALARAKKEVELQGLIASLTPQITEYLKKNSDIGVKLTKCTIRIAQLMESMKEQQDINVVREEQKSYAEALLVLQTYITSVLADIALKIEDQMNLELSRFSDLFCKINLSKTTHDGQIVPNCSISLYRDQYEYTFDMLSSGEQALVSLIFKLVISNLRGNVSLLFVDEGLDALDEVNRERILSLLEISPYSQVFIISHREDSAHIKAGQKILLRKEDGITQVINI